MILSFVLATTVFTSSQTAIHKELEPFTQIYVANQSQLTLVTSNIFLLDLTLQNIPTDKVITNVTNDLFSIQTKGIHNLPMIKGSLFFAQPLEKITATLSGWVKSEEIIKTNRLEIVSKVDGYVHVKVDVDELIITVGQGSTVQVEGSARSVKVTATSGGVVRAGAFNCTDADVSATMGAEVWLTAKTDYTAKATTGGTIYYKTMPSGNFQRTELTGGKIIP
ncbi:MAG: DUF2807 domain-containing protein [Flavobacteriales bacterium]|nr:DUF2807 domain-containing protein [Flavobacteriales bacterium]